MTAGEQSGEHLNPPQRSTLDDVELLERARRGEAEAQGRLYVAHREAALRLAHRLCDAHDAQDVVAAAFERVFAALRSGNGPRASFRAYLMTTVRSVHVDQLRRQTRVVAFDAAAEGGVLEVSLMDDIDARVESEMLALALRSLPRRWQLVLWWSVVEAQPTAVIGARLGISPNAAAALKRRAREGLRTAYFTHQAEAPSPDRARGLLKTF